MVNIELTKEEVKEIVQQINLRIESIEYTQLNAGKGGNITGVLKLEEQLKVVRSVRDRLLKAYKDGE